MTVTQLINASLRALGVLAAGEVAVSEDSTTALESLNRLIDRLAAERLSIFSITRTTWNLVSGTRDYTVGTGGTVNVARPVFIDHVNYINTSLNPNLELPLQSLTDDGWSEIRLKDLTSIYPISYYYNPTYPLGTLSLWMVPTSTTLQGALYAPAAVAEVTLSTTLSLPPGYRDMLITNLAIQLSSEYGSSAAPTPELQRQAVESLATVKRANYRLSDMSIDPALTKTPGRFGWSILIGP